MAAGVTEAQEQSLCFNSLMVSETGVQSQAFEIREFKEIWEPSQVLKKKSSGWLGFSADKSLVRALPGFLSLGNGSP